ncbi:DHRS11.2 family protein [Megaselia abdita]
MKANNKIVFSNILNFNRSTMDRWSNKTAVVTGASSGIGAACVVDLVKAGMNVAALARRENRLNEVKNSLPEELRSKVYPIKCDVSDEADVIRAFRWVDEHLGGTHVLVNNAGISRSTQLTKKDNTRDIKDVLDTNVMGVVYCVREAFQQMLERKVDGHVVIVNSIAGHTIPYIPGGSFNIYAASKHAVTAMTETYRQEFSNAGTNVKVTSISPGVVDTEIVPEDFKKAANPPMLKAEDISNAIVYCVSTPPNVQIHELTIKPLHEKF